MKKFKHLSLEEREILYGRLKLGLSMREIARRLGRHHTSLADELKNNISYFGNEYLPCRSQALANKRAQAPLKNPKVFLYVREGLRAGRSPEEIAGRLTIDYPEECIDDETIYRYIYSKSAHRYHLWQHLTLSRKKRMRKEGRRIRRDGKIPGSISIDLRPKEVDERKEIGHWETDNVVGKQTDTSTLSVSVERLTRVTVMTKLVNRTALCKTAAVTKGLGRYPEKASLTITADNSKENSYHQRIASRLGVSVYFCHAYHSWEKGTVENMNGRIRRYIKKGESIDPLTNGQIKLLENKLNNTPRKYLGYLTPYEKMNQALS